MFGSRIWKKYDKGPALNTHMYCVVWLLLRKWLLLKPQHIAAAYSLGLFRDISRLLSGDCFTGSWKKKVSASYITMMYGYWWEVEFGFFFLLYCISFCSWRKFILSWQHENWKYIRKCFNSCCYEVFQKDIWLNRKMRKKTTWLSFLTKQFVMLNYTCSHPPQSDAMQVLIRWPWSSQGTPPYWLGCRTILKEACWPIPQLAEQGLHWDQLDHRQSTARGHNMRKRAVSFIHSSGWKTIWNIFIWSGSIVTQIKLIFLEGFGLQ